jgi:Asp-tRNA(Asn)/Glu-tRNA(Gln) amidotransferase A subunit family amidase
MVGRFYGAQGHVPHVINAGLRPVTPVAVQIIGRRLTEERVISIAEEAGRLLRNDVTR